MCLFEKTKINEKEARDGHFKNCGSLVSGETNAMSTLSNFVIIV